MGGLSLARLLRPQNEEFHCTGCVRKTGFNFKTRDFSIRILYYQIPPPSWCGWTGASCKGKKRENCTLKISLKSCSVHFILRFLEENLGNTETTYTKSWKDTQPLAVLRRLHRNPARLFLLQISFYFNFIPSA